MRWQNYALDLDLFSDPAHRGAYIAGNALQRSDVQPPCMYHSQGKGTTYQTNSDN